MYKVEYQYEDEKTPHNRFYSALDSSTAKAMFEATCSEGTLCGCQVKIVDVCEIKANASESSYAKFRTEDLNREY
tara:strand:- start:326 stop:550 length:225 start_codon:yes stop_codon:yes gene_type:complete